MLGPTQVESPPFARLPGVMTMRRGSRWLSVLVLAVVVLLPALALAGPRSGGSFSGRSGFRSAPRYSGGSHDYGRNTYGGGSGSHFIFLPGWGWGSGYGYGGGGSLLGTLFVLAAVAVGASMLHRLPWTTNGTSRAARTCTSCRSPSGGPGAAFRTGWRRSPRRATPRARRVSPRCCNNRRSSCCATKIRSVTRPRRRADR